ncbi:hypothetical protein Hanom_Chr09g00823011 [Helianthus anomalus]
MVPSKNANRALIVQADESCDWSVQLGNSGGGGTTCYAEIVKNGSDGNRREMMKFRKVEDSSDDFSKHLLEGGSSTLCVAFMARLACQSSQVCFDKPILRKCVECMFLKGKYLELEGKFDHTKKHHQSMIVDLTKCTEANTTLKKNEKEFKTTIDTL